MRLASVLSAAVLVLAAGSATAQEMVDNVEFKMWSKFGKGASFTIKTTSTFAGMTTESTTTATLVEVGTDKLVVEQVAATKAGGMEFKTPPMKRDVPKRVAVPKDGSNPDSTPMKPTGTYEEGTETLKVAGTELKTKWYKYRDESSGVKTESKMWLCDDVPGSLVRMEMKLTGAMTGETTTELVEFKKP